jgi:hypothetical protein
VISEDKVDEGYRKVERNMSGQERYVLHLTNKWTE